MPFPTLTFNTIDEWKTWVDQEIIPNGQELITGNDGNITENAAVKFIKQSPLNWEKAAIVSLGGAVVASRPVVVFTTTTPTSLTWNDNIYNEYVFVNMTANAIPLLGNLVYYTALGNPVSTIPPNQVVNIVKSSNDLWVSANNILPTPLNNLVPDELDFEVTTTSIIPAGASSLTIDAFKGYNVLFVRGGIPQYKTTLNDGSTYFSWNKTTGLFTLLPAGIQGAATLGELFLIMPCTGRGFVVGTTSTPSTIILSGNGTFTLPVGFQIWKITINPSAADTVRIGTTVNGEEIMMDKVMTINTYANNGVTADVFAEGGDQLIYFTGFTGAATINIYTLPI